MNKLLIVLAITVSLFYSCKCDTKCESQEKILKDYNMNKNIAERNKKNTLAFFKALENENVDAIVELFADNAKHINPYASGLFPAGANGKEEIRAYWTPVFPNFDGMKFPVEYIYATEEPNFIIIKYTGKIKLKNNAGIYENNYYSTFRFNNDGKIIEYVEIFNPIVAAKAFGMSLTERL